MRLGLTAFVLNCCLSGVKRTVPIHGSVSCRRFFLAFFFVIKSYFKVELFGIASAFLHSGAQTNPNKNILFACMSALVEIHPRADKLIFKIFFITHARTHARTHTHTHTHTHTLSLSLSVGLFELKSIKVLKRLQKWALNC